MPTGFGHGPFGHGAFGEAWWGREAFWKSLPDSHRRYDVDNDDMLYKFVMSLSDTTDLLRRQARDMPDQRDPRRVQTRYNNVQTVTIDSGETVFVPTEDSDDGRAYMEIVVLTGDITRVAPGWTFVAENRSYIVRAVRKADATSGVDQGVLELFGDDAPTGTMFVRPPEIISFLGKDYGVEIDGNEPESFQRSTVYDAVKWYNQKGTELGLTLRASVAGFQATVRGLFSIGGDYSDWLGRDRVFEIPDGSGNWYTDVPPNFIAFDSVGADIFPLDTHCDVDSTAVGSVLVNSAGEFGAPPNRYKALRVDASGSALMDLVGPSDWYLESPSGVRWHGAASGLDFVLANEGGDYQVDESLAEVGVNYTLGVECFRQIGCDWCQSHLVRLELVIVDARLLSDPAALEGAFDRLVRKLSELIPAHVDLVQIVLDEASSATITLTATGTASTETFELYDDDAADAHDVDDFTVTFQ